MRKERLEMAQQSTRTEQNLGRSSWRRASLCGPNGGNCVEVNIATPGSVGVRDSKQLTGDVILRFDSETWTRFLTDMRAGTFDRE